MKRLGGGGGLVINSIALQSTTKKVFSIGTDYSLDTVIKQLTSPLEFGKIGKP